MPDRPTTSVTSLIMAYKEGNPDAFDRLMPLVYKELVQIANRRIQSKPVTQSLSPADLVHEVYLRLQERQDLDIRDRSHFFAMAAQCMRWILLDHAKAKFRQKREGAALRIEFDDGTQGAKDSGVELVALNTAFEKLAARDERLARVAELRFMSGMGVEETAQLLGVSPATVKRDWQLAKAWLMRELKGEPGE